MNRLVSGAIAALIALIVLMSTLFVVDQRQYAIVFALDGQAVFGASPG